MACALAFAVLALAERLTLASTVGLMLVFVLGAGFTTSPLVSLMSKSTSASATVRLVVVSFLVLCWPLLTVSCFGVNTLTRRPLRLIDAERLVEKSADGWNLAPMSTSAASSVNAVVQ